MNESRPRIPLLDGDADNALVDLLRTLGSYDFVAPTPATHRRFLDRNRRPGRDLRDVFGWNLPFRSDLLPSALFRNLERAQVLTRQEGGLFRAKIRVSTLDDLRFLHSAYPTTEEDAVFFGPDSYRFARFLAAHLRQARRYEHLVDMGAGTGVGGIFASSFVPGAKVTLVDVNPVALRFAAANAAVANVAVALVAGSSLADAAPADLIIANPPYMMDGAARAYRHGGDLHGARLSLDWALEAAEHLPAGGTMLLYTGAAIVDGRDGLRDSLVEALPRFGCTLSYEEIDPDVFGEELEEPAYRDVERIAAIGAVIGKTR